MLQKGPSSNLREKLILVAIFIVMFTLATLVLEWRDGNLP